MERSSNERYKKDKERYQFSEQQKRMEEAGWWGQKPTRVSTATASEWVSEWLRSTTEVAKIKPTLHYFAHLLM